jgi:catechol 2,3-dioxygenase-like lactoylglutathione lyase family enzyme
MIGYVTLGTNDLQRSAAYYDALLAELGGKRFMEMEGFIAWGNKPGQPMVGVILPFDKKAATAGNGTMISLSADSPATVERVYQKALELGSVDEGAAGPRGDTGFYAGYFRDPDGNKLCVFCISKPA